MSSKIRISDQAGTSTMDNVLKSSLVETNQTSLSQGGDHPATLTGDETSADLFEKVLKDSGDASDHITLQAVEKIINKAKS